MHTWDLEFVASSVDVAKKCIYDAYWQQTKISSTTKNLLIAQLDALPEFEATSVISLKCRGSMHRTAPTSYEQHIEIKLVPVL